MFGACQTELGKAQSGDGIISLTRGLLYLGASRVSVSLWSVNDQKNSKFTIAFHK